MNFAQALYRLADQYDQMAKRGAGEERREAYAPYEPEYCAEAVAAIESVMAEVRKHLKRASIDQPVSDAAALAKLISSKTKRGVGDAKQEEVRFLILSGLPHAEVVRRTGVSSGTVISSTKRYAK